MTLPLQPGEGWRVIAGDTLDLLPTLPDACVDAVVCDPPYGIDFKGHAWDGRAIRADSDAHAQHLSSGQAFEHWTTLWAAQLGRVLKPGGHLVAFGAPRTAHRLISGLEDAGLEIRDMLMWMNGNGMPKSRRFPGGRGTALKPFYEPIALARRPLQGTTAANLARYGTGTLNVEACAVADGTRHRWPANVALSHDNACRDGRCARSCPTRHLDRQDPDASRFVYTSKASSRERDAGCEHLPLKTRQLFSDRKRPNAALPRLRNTHPTVKPIELMAWLVQLVSPQGGIVLDPFCGSGSTGIAAVCERRRFLGIEREPEYVKIAESRIAHWEAVADE